MFLSNVRLPNSNFTKEVANASVRSYTKGRYEAMDIDLIVTWVDGNDPAWRRQRAQYAKDSDRQSADTFFRDWQLLRYWFRGVEQNVPWIRKIHFVTWGHLPQWLNTEHPKLHIVRHEDYIPSRYLPTFNSIPLALLMHHIEGLAEHFIYTNDDIYFIDSVSKEFYFQNALPCDAPILLPITELGAKGFGHILWNDISCINRHFNMSACIAKHYDKWFHPSYSKEIIQRNQLYAQLQYFPGFYNPHSPIPYLKSTFEHVWQKEKYLLEETCSHRFRNLKDINEWTMRYWQFAEGNFSPRMPNDCKYIIVTDTTEVLRDNLLSSQNRIVCLNEGTDDIDFPSRSAYLQRLFETILPQMSSYERF